MKQHVAEIVSAYLRRNAVAPEQLPALIASVNEALITVDRPTADPPLTPSVPIRRSVGAEAITCLDCGHRGAMLKRHLSVVHGMTVDEYRTRWGLPPDYPMVAKSYSARRSEIAKSLGLGRR